MWQLSKGQKEKATVFIEKHYGQLSNKQEFWLSKSESVEKMNETAEESNPIPENQPQPEMVRFLQKKKFNTIFPLQTMKKQLWNKLKLSFDQVYQLLRYGELRCRMAIAFFTWCVCSFSYYGLG